MSKEFKNSYNLLVVAHPDDETLFFSAALMQERKRPWLVVCATNGNADGAGSARALDFKKACQKLKIKEAIQWNFPDVFDERLDIAGLEFHLRQLPVPSEIYTHGITGEYGHPHHQDVSFAVHSVFAKKAKIWVPAYNARAEKTLRLTKSQYEIKANIYSEIYRGETLRFAPYIPNRSVDEFMQLDFSEVQEIYASILEKRAPVKSKLKKYKWFYSFLAEDNKRKKIRPF